MTTPDNDPIAPLPYATPGAPAGSPVAAGVWILIGGLVLIFFGGCFCIGVLIQTNGAAFGGMYQSQATTAPQVTLMVALYACAAACFGAGAFVLFLGLRKLLAVGR